MAQRYQRGQRVLLRPVETGSLAPRDADILHYGGQSGEIVDYHSLTMGTGITFYIYTVKVGGREIILHEDEMEPHIG